MFKQFRDSDKKGAIMKTIKEYLGTKKDSEVIVSLMLYGESFIIMDQQSQAPFFAPIDKNYLKKQFKFL